MPSISGLEAGGNSKVGVAAAARKLYEIERRPVALSLVHYQGADLSGNEPMAVPAHAQEPVEISDNVEDDARSGGGATANRQRTLQNPHGRQDHPGLELGFRYDESPICVPDGTPKTAGRAQHVHADGASGVAGAACLAPRVIGLL